LELKELKMVIPPRNPAGGNQNYADLPNAGQAGGAAQALPPTLYGTLRAWAEQVIQNAPGDFERHDQARAAMDGLHNWERRNEGIDAHHAEPPPVIEGLTLADLPPNLQLLMPNLNVNTIQFVADAEPMDHD